MLNAAMVLMILAGVFGLPAVMCSGLCAGIAMEVPESKGVMNFFMYLSIGASLGSIIVGALVRKLKKIISGLSALLFAGCFALLLLQGNMLGLLSSLMLIIAAIMIFVAPIEQFSNIQKVRPV